MRRTLRDGAASRASPRPTAGHARSPRAVAERLNANHEETAMANEIETAALALV
jgi:hypothetical protein